MPLPLDGVLFFPVTPFTADGDLAPDLLTEHVTRGLAHGPGGVFAACGTGELHALSVAEHETVVGTAVRAVAGRVPVVAGAGGPLPVAVEQARRAAGAGADGLLLLPPYLVAGPPEGTLRYLEAVAAATDLPVVVYQRAGAVFTPATAVAAARLPTVAGFKDGLGDLERMTAIVRAVRTAVGADFPFFNGLPTAEVTAPAYRGIGVELYSSAAFCCAPEVAMAFHRALVTGDRAATDGLLEQFFLPLARLRDRVPGYAVALVKAGVRARGPDVGGVRPPLVDPSEGEVAELTELLRTGLERVGASW
ncbi:MAG TPA: 5-dehydro-4-deoxyglucarate dehydratase [Pseudonocardia sp.]|nr:5-dehydro-4-deoxyglucarate dehydratase [Pseudonocardia sp.]